MIKKLIQRTGTYRLLENENKQLENRLEHQNNRKQKLENEKLKLKNKKKELEKQRYVLRNEKKHLENQLNYHKTQKQSIKDQLDNLKSQNETLDKQLIQEKNDNITLNEQLDNLKSQNETLDKQLIQEKNDNETLKEQLINLKRQDENLNKQLNHEKSGNKALKGLNNHLERVKENYISLVKNLMAENKNVKIEYEKNIELSSDYNKLTIIIPHRKTNDPEREKNLKITLNYLSKISIKNVIISEHSNESCETYLMGKYSMLFDSFKVIFSNANGNLFNKSHAINQGVKLSKTPYFTILDMDCITRKKNIDLALYLLDNGFDIVHPFNRVIKDIVDKEEFLKEYDFQTVESPLQDRKWADGGIVFWKKSSFISIGMKNENFSGWGGEDNEIIIRANLFGLKNYRIDDILYHLYHYRPLKMTKDNVEQIKKITQVKSKEELLKQINEWSWVVELKEFNQDEK